MYIDLQPIFDKYNIHPKGVIAVGAHYAEEHDDYVRWGIKKFVYIEPCTEAWKQIAVNLKLDKGFVDKTMKFVWLGNEDSIQLFRFACGTEEREMPMYISHQNQGQSNSLLKPELHLLQHPDILFNDAEVVTVLPLDNLPIQKKYFDFLVMDVQGYEGEVIKGANETLKYIDIIYSEVNRGQTYENNMEIDELDELLLDEGFLRVETYWPSENLTWGDAVYIRFGGIPFTSDGTLS